MDGKLAATKFDRQMMMTLQTSVGEIDRPRSILEIDRRADEMARNVGIRMSVAAGVGIATLALVNHFLGNYRAYKNGEEFENSITNSALMQAPKEGLTRDILVNNYRPHVIYLKYHWCVIFYPKNGEFSQTFCFSKQDGSYIGQL